MNSIHRKKRTIYINNEAFKTLKEAALKANMTKDTLSRRLRYGGEIKVNGLCITETPPAEETKLEKNRRLGPYALLRYPFGEDPIRRGLPGVWS